MKSVSSRERLIAAGAAGLLVGAVSAAVSPWQFAVLAGWAVTAAVFVVWVVASVGGLTPAETAEFSLREDSSRVATSILLLSASVVSLVGVGLDLVKAGHSHAAGRFTLTLLAVVTVGLSWAVVHTVFTLRYAREYYTDPVGGIDFKSDEQPDYRDFAYIAFTVGMTFQVSDTDVQLRRIRRTVLRHALLSYLFGAVILAVMVNVIAGVVNK